MDTQAGFDQTDIFIAGAKEAFDASADTHASLHGVVVGYLRRITRQESTLRWKRFDRSTTRSRGHLKTIWEYYTSAVKATRFRPDGSIYRLTGATPECLGIRAWFAAVTGVFLAAAFRSKETCS